MLDVKSNFKNLYENDLTCRTCEKLGSEENEDHILVCETLVSEIDVQDIKVEFDFVYRNIEYQKLAVKAYKSVLRKRGILLKFK